MATKAPKDWIKEYADPQRASDARSKQEQIATLLDSGIVLIGERHDQDEARAVIANLIAAGKIRHLILEITDYYAGVIPQFKKDIADGAKQLGLAAKGRENAISMMSKIWMGQFKGPELKGDQIKINFGLLIYRALKYGCEVHCADTKLNDMTSPENMNKRDDRVAALVRDLVGKGIDKNLVVLFGASHFSPFASQIPSLELAKRIDTLSGVPNHRVFTFA